MIQAIERGLSPKTPRVSLTFRGTVVNLWKKRKEVWTGGVHREDLP